MDERALQALTLAAVFLGATLANAVPPSALFQIRICRYEPLDVLSIYITSLPSRENSGEVKIVPLWVVAL